MERKDDIEESDRYVFLHEVQIVSSVANKRVGICTGPALDFLT